VEKARLVYVGSNDANRNAYIALDAGSGATIWTFYGGARAGLTVNDVNGHLAGSHTLMEVASVILPSVRDTDCVVRYGGDEFVVILPETSALEAVRVADRIRAKIERHRFTGGRRLQIHLTSSIGLAVFPDDALSPHQLIACADRAMYAAKAANKNCVRVMTSLDLRPAESSLGGDAVDGPQFQRIPAEKFIS
jgi:diguanylate cyclase (GGDEF)-like protein